MRKPDGFPKDMFDFLESEFGQLIGVETLSGVAGSNSYTCKLQFFRVSTVVKLSANPRERLFYERYAGNLRPRGVPIAEVYWSGMDECQHNWIALEEVPGVFPKEQWRNNPHQLKILCNLHSCSSEHLSLGNEEIWYRPKWDEELTELALSWYRGNAERDEVKNLLLNAEQLSQILFVPNCGLSGDPNPTNWRVRKSGELVMIDWERFCQGSPAIDLAITMPNLGTLDLSLETEIARNYIRLWNESGARDPLPSDHDVLAFQIRLGKIWTVVEFIANAAREPKNYPEQTIGYIVAELPQFLRTLP